MHETSDLAPSWYNGNKNKNNAYVLFSRRPCVNGAAKSSHPSCSCRLNH